MCARRIAARRRGQSDKLKEFVQRSRHRRRPKPERKISGRGVSITKRYWIYVAATVAIVIGLIVKAKQNEAWSAGPFIAIVIFGAGSFLFRCPGCRYPVAWVERGRRCRRCGAHL